MDVLPKCMPVLSHFQTKTIPTENDIKNCLQNIDQLSCDQINTLVNQYKLLPIRTEDNEKEIDMTLNHLELALNSLNANKNNFIENLKLTIDLFGKFNCIIDQVNSTYSKNIQKIPIDDIKSSLLKELGCDNNTNIMIGMGIVILLLVIVLIVKHLRD